MALGLRLKCRIGQNPPPMNERAKNRVQHVIEPLAQVLRQKAKHKVTVLLQQGVLPPVTPLRLRVRQVLRPIHLDHQLGRRAQEIHFHRSTMVEGQRQLGI